MKVSTKSHPFLEPSVSEYLQSLIALCPSIREIWLIDSRANNASHTGSDWDFIAFADGAALKTLNDRLTGQLRASATAFGREEIRASAACGGRLTSLPRAASVVLATFSVDSCSAALAALLTITDDVNTAVAEDSEGETPAFAVALASWQI